MSTKWALFAGFVTTSSTLSSLIIILMILMHSPDVEKKLVQEIDDIIGRDRMPRQQDKAMMPPKPA